MNAITRRAALLAGCAACAMPAAAQGGLVLAAPMPCATQSGDILGLVLEGSGAPDGTVVVFGQPFKPGDFPRDASLGARLANGRAVPAQADVKTRHADGSARFAVVSLAPPGLRAGALSGVVLTRGAGTPPAALDAATLLANRRALVEITGAAGGAPWQADLVALARGAARPWQAGPLAVQLRVAAPVPASACGVASMRLVADLSLRADGSFWADLWLRNDIAMQPNGGTATYALRVELDGREVLRTGAPIRQVQYTGWGRYLGVGTAGAVPALPALMRPDTAYLNAAGAVAHYDTSIGLAPALLAELARHASAPGWVVPLDPRGVTQYMPMTGGRSDIGPATMVQAAWLTTGDRRAALLSVGQAEAAGAVPWHLWDASGGADGKGGWMDTQRWPGLWTDPRGGRPPRSLLAQPEDSGWVPDIAHQPDLSYVPYLLTGRRALLDNLLAQGGWNILRSWPQSRAEATGFPAVRDLNVVPGQVRGGAWALRQVDEAAWAAPDNDTNGVQLRRAATANWGWLVAQIPRWTREQGEAHGWIPGSYGTPGAMAPWQQDYFASSAAAAARRGSTDAATLLRWMENFLVGRFMAEAKGFARIDGIAYNIALWDRSGRGPAYTSWAQIGAETRARGWSNGDGWSKIDRTSRGLALVSLASLIDLSGSDGAKQAFAWLSAQAVPPTPAQEFARYPTLNISPRGLFRVASQAPRCT